jgi:hypothetical protein
VITALSWLWIAAVSRARAEFRLVRLKERAQDVPVEERTGLACLLELARIWPASRGKRIELILVATGGQTLDFAGAREAARKLRSDWLPKPTLLLLLFGPGIGQELEIVSRRHDQPGHEAAESLWIPHRTNKRAEALVDLWPLERQFPDHLAILGELSEPDRMPALDTESLNRVCQLVVELALRWAKSEDRSSTINEI